MSRFNGAPTQWNTVDIDSYTLRRNLFHFVWEKQELQVFFSLRIEKRWKLCLLSVYRFFLSLFSSIVSFYFLLSCFSNHPTAFENTSPASILLRIEDNFSKSFSHEVRLFQNRIKLINDEKSDRKYSSFSTRSIFIESWALKFRIFRSFTHRLDSVEWRFSKGLDKSFDQVDIGISENCDTGKMLIRYLFDADQKIFSEPILLDSSHFYRQSIQNEFGWWIEEVIYFFIFCLLREVSCRND